MPQYYKVLDNGQGPAKNNQKKAAKSAGNPKYTKYKGGSSLASDIGYQKASARRRADKARVGKMKVKKY